MKKTFMKPNVTHYGNVSKLTFGGIHGPFREIGTCYEFVTRPNLARCASRF